MKMLRSALSPGKNAVLMSPDTNSHLLDATHCKIKASAGGKCGAVSSNFCQVWVLEPRDAEGCLGFPD